MLTTNIFTPVSGPDTEEYFMKHMPVFMTLSALFITSHFLFNFDESSSTIVGRIVAGSCVFATGILRKKWLIYPCWYLDHNAVSKSKDDLHLGCLSAGKGKRKADKKD